MKLTEAKLKKLILETINETDFRPELDPENKRKERERLAMDQRGRRMRAFDRIPMSDKWDDWEKRHKSKIVEKQSGEFGEYSTLDYYLWSKEPMRDLTTHHYGDYWVLDPESTQNDTEYYVVKRVIGPSGDERAYQDAMRDAGLSEARNSKKAVLKLAVGDVTLDIPAGFYKRKDGPDRMNSGHHQVVIVTSDRMKMMDITYEYSVEDISMNIFVRDPDDKILGFAGSEYISAGNSPQLIRQKFNELMDTLKKEK